MASIDAIEDETNAIVYDLTERFKPNYSNCANIKISDNNDGETHTINININGNTAFKEKMGTVKCMMLGTKFIRYCRRARDIDYASDITII